MKVITGTAKGKTLATLEGLDVRPTTDKVKGSLFSAIQFEIQGRRVLDLFAGSGQLGIEALSRGAQSTVFIDKDKKALSVIRENLGKTQLSDCATILCYDYESFLKNTTMIFDIAFLDPPYNKQILQTALPLVAERMSNYGIIICEHDKYEKLEENVSAFSLFRQYNHGRVMLSIYKRGE